MRGGGCVTIRQRFVEIDYLSLINFFNQVSKRQKCYKNKFITFKFLKKFGTKFSKVPTNYQILSFKKEDCYSFFWYWNFTLMVYNLVYSQLASMILPCPMSSDGGSGYQFPFYRFSIIKQLCVQLQRLVVTVTFIVLAPGK